ncbi:hypothetical protein [Caldalkalibacillus mannanilyticus]|uniref:hypothetical protein n=1 Tax=Caldalkalibacillus mannanilyticus TaxID=1418 RepID=UPI000467FC84|nr:hypothetical protein [Caldalkalibacillus mannanilyticus]
MSKIERIKEFFNHDDWREQIEEADLLKMMTHLSVFVHEQDSFPITELMEISNKSRYKINQLMSHLDEQGYVELVSLRPKEYKVSDEFLERVLTM